MKKLMAARGWSLSLFTGILVSMLVTFSAHAQCPDTVTDPNELLQGEWAFNTAGTGLPFTQRRQGSGQARRLFGNPLDSPLGSGLKQGMGQPVASAGSFVASVGAIPPNAAAPRGLLSTTITTSRNGEIDPGNGNRHLSSILGLFRRKFNLQPRKWPGLVQFLLWYLGRYFVGGYRFWRHALGSGEGWTGGQANTIYLQRVRL
jgi:hypothetical protein